MATAPSSSRDSPIARASPVCRTISGCRSSAHFVRGSPCLLGTLGLCPSLFWLLRYTFDHCPLDYEQSYFFYLHPTPRQDKLRTGSRLEVHVAFPFGSSTRPVICRTLLFRIFPVCFACAPLPWALTHCAPVLRFDPPLPQSCRVV